MKKIFLITIGISVFFIDIAHAAFFDRRLGDSLSSITIRNSSEAQMFTITGVFIQQLFQADCTTSYFDNHGDLYGAMWSNDMTLNPSASAPLGAGYVYSMMMNYLYEAAQNSGPAPTTPGNGAGTWCVQLGILQGTPAQYPTYTVGTNTSPSAALSNVVTWSNNTTPAPIAITCVDATQMCTSNASATLNFPSS
ncbi:MAG: hypothetical protein GW760_00850 [Legionella sp.]|jgi:hypothetical protein|nr:hypothetical protein [Legionella sp.]